jgi:hypothetical protein
MSRNFMRILFDKPLREPNNKVGTSGLVNDPLPEVEHENAKETRTSKTPLLDGLKQPPTDFTPRENTATAASTRPSRLTRSAPTHNIDDLPDRPEVFKYSVVVGLGPPWKK